MGKSSVHERTGEPDVRPRVKLARQTVYVDFAPADAVTAERLAADLERVGVNCWLHEHEAVGFNWAGGVHPALSGCDRMIYVLSSAALDDPLVEQAWRYFREKHKPIIVAQLDDSAPPDALRRRPRFDLSQQYKAAFRQLLQSLNDGR
ncbi:MAG: toll/interleukin-1 receptor domain-containing protein [Anaerolineae bacterium]|nr:toll/interleukin-1 receptor domain-containing protein [Anaerolineae bacterium]